MRIQEFSNLIKLTPTHATARRRDWIMKEFLGEKKQQNVRTSTQSVVLTLITVKCFLKFNLKAVVKYCMVWNRKSNDLPLQPCPEASNSLFYIFTQIYQLSPLIDITVVPPKQFSQGEELAESLSNSTGFRWKLHNRREKSGSRMPSTLTKKEEDF